VKTVIVARGRNNGLCSNVLTGVARACQGKKRAMSGAARPVAFTTHRAVNEMGGAAETELKAAICVFNLLQGSAKDKLTRSWFFKAQGARR
jgi:hypothetical protein